MGSPQRSSINSAPISLNSSHRPSRTCSRHWTSRHKDHCRSEPDSQEALSKQIVRIQTDLFPVDDEEIARIRLAGSRGRHTVQLVPNGFSSQDRRLARSLCLGESKRDGKGVEKTLCSWHSWTSRRPLTTYSTPSQPQPYNRKGYQSSCSRYSTNGGPRATLKSAWQASPVTNASRGLPQGTPESPAIFVAVSDHVLGNLDAGWRNRNIGWKMVNVHLTSIAFADHLSAGVKQKRSGAYGQGMHRWFPGCRLGNGIGQNFLDQHNTITGRRSDR